MYTLRCTQRLLRRLPLEPTPGFHTPTTTLGDWYATMLYIGRAQLVLCTSELSLLSVIVPAKGPGQLPLRLQEAVGSILRRLGVPVATILSETHEMSRMLVGRTANRSVLGSMVEISRHCRWRVADRGGPWDPESLALEMAEMPMLSLQAVFPREMVAQLLGAT